MSVKLLKINMDICLPRGSPPVLCNLNNVHETLAKAPILMLRTAAALPFMYKRPLKWAHRPDLWQLCRRGRKSTSRTPADGKREPSGILIAPKCQKHERCSLSSVSHCSLPSLLAGLLAGPLRRYFPIPGILIDPSYNVVRYILRTVETSLVSSST